MATQSGAVMRPHKLAAVLRSSLLRLKALELQWDRSYARGSCSHGSTIGRLSRQCTANSFATFAPSTQLCRFLVLLTPSGWSRSRPMQLSMLATARAKQTIYVTAPFMSCSPHQLIQRKPDAMTSSILHDRDFSRTHSRFANLILIIVALA